MKYSLEIYDNPTDLKPIIKVETQTKDELIVVWRQLINSYEGYEYEVSKQTFTIISGSYDMNDIEVIISEL